LVCSTCPPVSVCGTGARFLTRGFSWRYGLNPFGLGRSPLLPITPRSPRERICLSALPTCLEASRPRTYPPASPHRSNKTERYWNLNQLSITYASRPRLRPDSPAADQHGCGTLGHSVGKIRTSLSLLMPTFALPPAPDSLPLLLLCWTGRSPTTQRRNAASAASAPDLSPGGLSAPRHLRPVSYYALFKGWLLLSQPPGC
jgi:hypothetical protein